MYSVPEFRGLCLAQGATFLGPESRRPFKASDNLI